MVHIPQSMKALQLREIGNLEMTTILVPVPKSDEVLIRTRATTICTSDLHDIKINPFGIQLPRVLGHEAAGEVVMCGSDVEGLVPGSRVAIHPVIPCGFCTECQRGFGHICLNMGHLGIDRDGTFSEYFVQRADRVQPIPNRLPFELGSLLEPVSVCLQAISRANGIKDKTVFIAGDGPFGNIIARLARNSGAARVLVSGREPFRLGLIPDVEILKSVPEKTADVSILAVSSVDAFVNCLKVLRPRGRLVVFSTIKPPVPVDLFTLHISELEIVGACNDENRISDSLNCLLDSTLNPEQLITHKIPFENWKEAFRLASEGHNEALKVALVFE